MLIEWDRLGKYVDPNDIENVLHVGGHLAEEQEFYETTLNSRHVLWIEADEERANQIRENIRPSDVSLCAVVSDLDGKEVVFHEANNGQSSSILELGTHKTAHPEVSYVSERSVITVTIDTLIGNEVEYQFVNLDIQGAELLALQGMDKNIGSVKYIYTEVNREKLYQDCCLVEELDQYLSDFERVITDWTNFGWGDALYVRREVK